MPKEIKIAWIQQTVHALEIAATVIGSLKPLHVKNISDKLRYNDKLIPNNKRVFYDIFGRHDDIWTSLLMDYFRHQSRIRTFVPF
jgi:hypothetical protein